MPTAVQEPTPLQKCLALLRMRCPGCCRGPIYARGFTMHTRCPECGLLYEREPGYFIGALYLSYGMASLILLAGLGVLHLLLPDWDLGVLTLIVGALFLPLAPAVTRYARVTWMYFDRWAWPSRPGQPD